mmetsp:Transcript_46893/g.101876  ORF Transcript_46893/g.101876 Transcript_46893/m.101876 type:complete len:503 (-) Transcript_46893:89-1597(-)
MGCGSATIPPPAYAAPLKVVTAEAVRVSAGTSAGSTAPPAPILRSGSSTGRSGLKTRALIEVLIADDRKVRRPCKYGLGCYRRNDEHLAQFSHPDDDEYGLGLRKYGGKGEFFTLKQCFRYIDPGNKGIIDEMSLLGELLHQLDRGVSTDELARIWGALDDDGNGYVSFSEFVEWAGDYGIDMPIGVDGGETGPSQTGTIRECKFMGCSCKNFDKGSQEKFCRCGHKRSLHAAADDKNISAALPPYWGRRSSTTSVDSSHAFYEWVPCDSATVARIQAMIDHSVKPVWTRDRGRTIDGQQAPVPTGYEVMSVRRNENSKIWRKYSLKKSLLRQSILGQFEDPEVPPFKKYEVMTAVPGIEFDVLDKECNEWYLWHGTSVEGAENICEVDFKQRLAGSATGTLYGPGTYFAESCTKADEYARGTFEAPDVFTLLLVRIMGGRVMFTDEPEPNSAELTDAVLHGPYDSVLGDRVKCRGTFREFVIFGSDQAYPEYIVTYKRRYC